MLPTVKALQAFEAAARRLSFRDAASELNVTPAAISQQIRALETDLGIRLFARTGRGVRLTETGADWLPEVRRCLELLRRTVEAATARAADVLAITLAPSLASRWLMGRLYRFSEREPDISVRVVATPEVIDLADSDVDLAIRFGPGAYPGLSVERVMPELLVPMCAPGLIEPGADPNVLERHTLIHDDSISGGGGGWSLWLRAVGATRVDPRRGPRYSLADIAMQEAIAGRGVVLARWQLAAQDLAAGRLVCPFDRGIESPYAYYLVTRPEMRQAAKVVAFRDWLLGEIATVPTPAFAVIGR